MRCCSRKRRHQKGVASLVNEPILARVGDKTIKLTVLTPEAKCSVCSKIAGQYKVTKLVAASLSLFSSNF